MCRDFATPSQTVIGLKDATVCYKEGLPLGSSTSLPPPHCFGSRPLVAASLMSG